MTKMKYNVRKRNEKAKHLFFDDIGQCSVIIRNIRVLTQMKMPANTNLFLNLRRLFVCKLFLYFRVSTPVFFGTRLCVV